MSVLNNVTSGTWIAVDGTVQTDEGVWLLPHIHDSWEGYLQGILIERGVLTVEHEREYRRNLYKPVYEQLGYDTTTIDVE